MHRLEEDIASLKAFATGRIALGLACVGLYCSLLLFFVVFWPHMPESPSEVRGLASRLDDMSGLQPLTALLIIVSFVPLFPVLLLGMEYTFNAVIYCKYFSILFSAMGSTTRPPTPSQEYCSNLRLDDVSSGLTVNLVMACVLFAVSSMLLVSRGLFNQTVKPKPD